MSGQRTSSIGGTAESVAAGCVLRELRPKSRRSGGGGGNQNSYGNGSSTVLWGEDAGLAVFTWGRGEDGQLGLGDTSDQDEPTYVDALRGVGVRQIACGSGHTVVLTTDGEVYTWGESLIGCNVFWSTLFLMDGLISSLLFVTAFLFLSGRGDDGRLGHGDNGWKYVPRIVQSLAGLVVVQVTCGSYHTAAVTGNGDLYTW